jgi:hypothetical protein
MACRYMQHSYKQHYACFACRKVFRIPGSDTPFNVAVYSDPFTRKVKCPDCSRPMFSMGRDFKAPRRSAMKQWEKVRQLRVAGIAFESCGCVGPGYRPGSLREVASFIEQHEVRKSKGRQLANRFKGRSGSAG